MEVHHTGCVDLQLVEIAEELMAIAQSNRQDPNWQPHYDNERNLIEDLRNHAERMRRGDSSRLPELRCVLLPTGALNEIAFSSGWGTLMWVQRVRMASHGWVTSRPLRPQVPAGHALCRTGQ